MTNNHVVLESQAFSRLYYSYVHTFSNIFEINRSVHEAIRGRVKLRLNSKGVKMVANRPLVTLPADEDSVLLSHPIHELLNSRSWENDNINSADTEDDGLQKEIDLLSCAEHEVSKEISDLVRLFSKQPEKQTKKVVRVLERGPRRLNSSISPMNAIYTEFTKREERDIIQEQLGMTNQETIRFRNTKKTRDNISNIPEVDIGMIIKDTRESPGRSQPYDEMSNGIMGVCTREPAEEIIFVGGDESHDGDDRANVFGDALHYASTDFSESESMPESEEMFSLNEREGTDVAIFVHRNGEEEKFVMHREWGQSTDLEKGGNNLFEDEAFWEKSFWKTPVDELASHHTSAVVQQEQPNKGESSEMRKLPHISQSRQAIIGILSLPTLEHKRDENLGRNTELDCQSIRSRPKESNREFIDTSARSDVHRNISHSRESIEPRSLPQKSSQIFPFMNENHPITHTETQENSHTFALHVAVSSEGEDVVTLNKKISHQRNDMCNWRIIVLAIHVTLTIIGGAIFWYFLRSKDSQN
jgi:hypothetical protein